MANFCLPRERVEAFVEGLKSGELDPEKLADMTSAERRDLFDKYVGKGTGKLVNADFESKLLLKNQNQGFKTWIEKTVGLKPAVRRDMLAKVERLGGVLDPEDKEKFLNDLVAQRLGTEVTAEQAQHIATMSKDIVESKDKWSAKLEQNKEWSENPTKTRKDWYQDADRLDYGLKTIALKNYTDDLLLDAKKISFKSNPVQKILSVPKAAPGFAKAVLASLDDSFFGRQGINSLLDVRKSRVWGRNFLKSFKDLGKQTFARGKWYKSGDNAVEDMAKADIISRPNAMNGKYKAGGYGLDALSEEAYPTSLPEKIPLFGRLFKASEVAYNVGGMRMRADLADNLIAKAEKFGVNTLDKKEAEPLGHLVSSMTGRGDLGKFNNVTKELNSVLFSPKFLKSNLDTLTAGLADRTIRSSKFARKEAAQNLASITATVAGVLTIANILDPGSVDLDPRSTDFGKIKINGNWVDITGGKGSLITLASRLVPTFHNGKLSLWSKSSTGKYTDLLAGGYGAQTGVDVFDDFIHGKAAPALSTLLQAWKGTDYSGAKNTPGSFAQNLVPMPISNLIQFSGNKGATAASVLSSEILDGLGFSNTVPVVSDWSNSTSSVIKSFQSQVSPAVFEKANQTFNDSYAAALAEMKANPKFKALPTDDQNTAITKEKARIQATVLSVNGYKAPKTTSDKSKYAGIVK